MANNPTPLALIDTLHSLRVPSEHVRVLSVGTGAFPKRRGLLHGIAYRWSPRFRRFMTLLESSTRTMEWLNQALFRHIHALRINGTRTDDGFRTSFHETDVRRLEKLYSAGVDDAENAIRALEALFGLGTPD